MAYLQRKMPYHYFVFKRLLLEVQARVEELQYGAKSEEDPDLVKKLSVLDYGAGLGSGLWAAIHCYGHEQVARVAAVEPNVNMRKLGRFLT